MVNGALTLERCTLLVHERKPPLSACWGIILRKEGMIGQGTKGGSRAKSILNGTVAMTKWESREEAKVIMQRDIDEMGQEGASHMVHMC